MSLDDSRVGFNGTVGLDSNVGLGGRIWIGDPPGKLTRSMMYGASQDGNEPVVDIRPRMTAEAGTATCEGFNSIYQDGGNWYFTGGVVSTDVQNHAIADQTFSTAVDNTFYVYITVTVTANTSDGVLISGISASSVTGSPISSQTGSYPGNTVPTAASPTQDFHIPMGVLVISGGVPTFTQHGPCSPIRVQHCPGSVTYDHAG